MIGMSALTLRAWTRRLIATLMLALAAASAATAAPVNAGHLSAELVADSASIAPGGVIHLALRQSIEKDWHTYWRNPGDSGQATTLTWTLPAGWRAGEIVWPTPERLKIGPLMDYGYSGEVLLPLALTAPASARPGTRVSLKAQASFLVCKDVCVPEDATLTLDLPVAAGAPQVDPTWGSRIAGVLSAAPKPAGLAAAVTPAATALKLSIVGPQLKGADVSAAYFFPYDATVIDHAQPQSIERGPNGLTLTLTPGFAFKSGKAPTVMSGVLSVGAKAYEIDAHVGPVLAGASGLGPPAAPGGWPQVAAAVGFAFLGGLILNLMPCVFPVLSMKAVALTRHAHEARAARIQGLAFMAGVVATFLALAAALIAARAAGQAVGWGFQLQSPAVIAGLCLVMLLVALNLSGVFEVGASLQSLAGGVGAAGGDSPIGAVLTGALAVAVAAPCTAPFMAGAIGFALTQGPAVALLIFFALALGMAAPFTALAFAPGLLSRLPRPGPWMDVLRKVFAFPMYATAAWLLWVFSQQTGTFGLAQLLAAAVLTGLAAWLYGAAQQARLSGGRGWVTLAGAAVALALALGAALGPAFQDATAAAASSSGSVVGELPSEPFSPARLEQLRAEGRPVFVNFTAAWCVTCQVNERLALSSPRVADMLRRSGAVYMKGDWTNRDAAIATALAEHGRAGVPLYLVYPKAGGEPAVLPQILTEAIVVDALRKAGGS
jgi:thiol:disulfide interchange protein